MRISSDATDASWEGLAEVVPLRGEHTWDAWETVPHLPTPAGADIGAEALEDARQLVVVRVQSFSDARVVAEHLMTLIPVLLDLSAVEGEVGRRVLDFASGVVFGLGGGMHRVDTDVFLVTPAGTEVSDR
ncbi:cell division protein SepF [Streptomyces sp. JJ66]|uniref:cell division protein SepF n=1 Tax=Streptomyces sp. JJ66 TaxID=2803843 RepID=UPI001C567682|nr:cell division protein SepF [Streptomyces sp. JJ66]MBW1600764.1 cell division protein SepF [Streptomyces sp. JJ66]